VCVWPEVCFDALHFDQPFFFPHALRIACARVGVRTSGRDLDVPAPPCDRRPPGRSSEPSRSMRSTRPFRSTRRGGVRQPSEGGDDLHGLLPLLVGALLTILRLSQALSQTLKHLHRMFKHFNLHLNHFHRFQVKLQPIKVNSTFMMRLEALIELNLFDSSFSSLPSC
jgi:hypothetical protein